MPTLRRSRSSTPYESWTCWGRRPSPQVGESNIHLFFRPRGTALDVEEPAVDEAVAEPGGGRGQEVVADSELRRNRHARRREFHTAGRAAFQAGPGGPSFYLQHPARGELIVAADLSTTHEAGRIVTR